MNESCQQLRTNAQLVTNSPARNKSSITNSGDGRAFQVYQPLLQTLFKVMPSVFKSGTLQGKPSFTLDDMEAAQ